MKRTKLAALTGICFILAACGEVQDVDTGCHAGTHLDATGACVGDTVDAGSTTDAGPTDGADAGQVTNLPSWCFDQDGDGFPADHTNCVFAQTQPANYARADAPVDCNDSPVNGRTVNPGQSEIAGNGINDDCNEATSDASNTVSEDTCVYDQDGDGYQLANAATYKVAAGATCPGLYTKARTDGKVDCDDTNAAVNTVCTASTTRLYCPDQDSDGYPLGGTSCLQAATAPVNYIEPRADGKVDCVDNDAAVNPSKTEIVGNGKDDDCSAATPDVVTANTELCIRDQDGDGYPKANPATADTKTVTTGVACESGYIKARADGKTDCNDDPSNGGAAVNPGATEICNGKDDNCAGGIDEGFNIGGQCDGRYGLCAVRGVLECSSTTQVRCSVDVGGSQSRVQTEIVGNSIDEDCDGTAQQSSTQTTTVTDGFRYTAPSGYVVLSGTVSQCTDSTCTSFTGALLAGTASGSTFTFSQVRPRGQGTRYYRVNVNMATSSSLPANNWGCYGWEIRGTFDQTGSVGATLTTPVGTVSNGGGGCENVLRFQDN